MRTKSNVLHFLSPVSMWRRQVVTKPFLFGNVCAVLKFVQLILCLVDEDNDLDVDAVLQQHSGDVKFVTWSPIEDVSF